MNDRRSRLQRATEAWSAATGGIAARFDEAARDPRSAQEAVLAGILGANAGCPYGRAQRFDAIKSIVEYQTSVPIVSYDDIAEALSAGTMTAEGPLMFETTSGSSAAVKRIPYTAKLRSEFMAALEAWMFDLYASHPQLHGGSAYWSVSPVVAARGFNDDRDYFDGPSREALDEILTLPPAVAALTDLQEQRFTTLQLLAADRELSFISVWNPTILTIFVRDLERWFDRIIEAVAHHDRRRAAELRQAGPVPTAIWPRLSVISCWADAAASLAIPAVRRLFPAVSIQPKGLLATEGIVSIPFGDGPGSVLAISSHFLEFRAGEETLTADQLETGREYEIILTTGGGLYRYALGDVVRVVGRHALTPRIEFVGRSGHVADLTGEKLSEPFVRSVLGQFQIDADLLFLAPVWDDERRGYALFLESNVAEARLREIARAIDAALAANVHYDYCRRSGQLGPLIPIRLTPGAAGRYLEIRATTCRVGDVKPRALETELGWMERLTGAEVVR